MIQPTLEMAESYSKDRISPMIRDSPALAELIDDKSRTSGNTNLSKHFLGGLLQLAGSNSPASLASRPIRDVIIDEEDRSAGSAGKEGDPEKLAKRRQTTFYDAKLIAGGTPVLKGGSKSERGFLKGDQRRYQLESPCCSEHIALEWEDLQHEPSRPHYAEFQCPKCEGWIEHKHKARMVRDVPMGGTAYWEPSEKRRAVSWSREKGEWTREPEPVRYEWNAELGRYEEASPVVRSYYIWAAYSPFISWKEICDEYNEARTDPELLQTFYNTIVGRPYEYTQNDLDPDELHKRAEEWKDMVLPRAVLAITAGVDTQNDRFEVSVIGWGRNEEAFVLEHFTVAGDPEEQDTRLRLYEALTKRRYTVDGGRELSIRGVFVDLGGQRTDSVYKFVKGKQHLRIYACKGLSTRGNPLFNGFSKQKKAGVKIGQVDTVTAKETIYAKLAMHEDEAGRVHFVSDLPKSYYEGLVSEERIEGKDGKIKYEKKKAKIRNEPLDCFVYAYAACRAIHPSLRKVSRRMKSAQDAAARAARQAEQEHDGEEEAEIDEKPNQESGETKPEPKTKPKRWGRVVKMAKDSHRRWR
ncbi:MAG: phage terminase large subunit family protein [Verrucomicrobiota bacterium JB023]|nr:phage terminase large subunit family protein [Verrucomicrobiota bacterium JB023]